MAVPFHSPADILAATLSINAMRKLGGRSSKPHDFVKSAMGSFRSLSGEEMGVTPSFVGWIKVTAGGSGDKARRLNVV